MHMQTDLNARIFRSCSCEFIHRHGHRTHFHLPQAIQHARVLALINIVLKEEPRHLEKRQRRHQRVASGLVRRPNALDLCVCVCQSSSTTERYAQDTARQMVIQPPHLKGFGAPIEAALEHHAHSPTHLKGFGDPIEAAFERLAAFHNILDVKEAREVVA